MARLKVGFIPIEGGQFYREALEEVVRAEELGFDSAWMGEHHGVKDHYWPSPLPVLAGFATRTSRLILGTDILVFAFYHPVRLTEDVALLDQISGGRFVLGTTIGYKPDEFALYNTPLGSRGVLRSGHPGPAPGGRRPGARGRQAGPMKEALWTS